MRERTQRLCLLLSRKSLERKTLHGRGPHAVRAQRGMTLIELGVAMTVALLILGSVALVFAGTSRNRNALERSARLAENAQYALEVLRTDIAQAGYYDTLTTSAGGFTWQLRDPCVTAIADLGWSNPVGTVPPVNAKIENAPVPIFGVPAGAATPACLAERKIDTSILVVRFVGPDATAPAAASGAPFLQLSKCAAETPNKLNLGVFSSDPTHFTLRNIGCAAVADVKRYVVRTYYVATCNRCGTDTIPTLKRAELVNGEIVITSLVEGVENFQVEYGLDGNGDGTPDRFLELPDATLGAAFGDWANVMAVKLYVLARSTEAEPGYSEAAKRFNLGPAGYIAAPADGYKRLLATSLARPMGPAGQRETP